MNTSEPINIYYSHWKQLLIVLGCIAFAVICFFALRHPNAKSSWASDFGLWGGLVFFGGIGLLMLFNLLKDLKDHIPFLTIYDDHLSMYSPLKKTFWDVNFSDVVSFELQSFHSGKGGKMMILCIHYKENVQREKMETSGFIKKSLFRFNNIYAGAMESIPLSMLTMKSREIAEAVDAKFKSYKQTETL
jgi:hypothetical protein